MGTLILAPFSNSDIRDWPVGHWAALAGHLLDRWPETTAVQVIGTRNQFTRACEIVRRFDPVRVVNMCGRMTWPQVLGALRGAACVVGNNSGIPHLAASFGVPTVCVFGGSHQRMEWRPLGLNAVVVSRQIGCSPCQLDHGQVSPFGKACLRRIDPLTVADAVDAIVARVERQSRERLAHLEGAA